MKADPKCAENFSLLAELLETTLADPIKATKCYTKAVGLDPYDIGSARSLARLLGAAGEFAGLQVTARWLHLCVGTHWANRLTVPLRSCRRFVRTF